MSEPTAVNWGSARCVYAEDLNNKQVTVTVGAVRDTPKGAVLFCAGVESEAWDVAFADKGKDGKTPYIQIPKPNAYGKKTGLLRQYVVAMGSTPDAAHVG